MQKSIAQPNAWAYLIAGVLVLGTYSLFGWWGLGAGLVFLIAWLIRDRVKKGYWT